MPNAILQYVGPPMARGPAVVMLQRQLAQLTLLPPEDVDGLFGPQTSAAVCTLQQRLRVPVTGIVDADLSRRLAEATASATFDTRPAAESDRTTAARARPLAVVSADMLPTARPRRVILHWTAGNARASDSDLQHYHFCIEQDGTVVQGRRTIADNDSTTDGRYAMHTLNCNTRAVGIALCGMVGAVERPFRAGSAPIREAQLPVLARLAAQICDRYGIAVTPQTVLAHGEVQDLLGIKQKQKWDPLVLPWNTSLSKREVGDLLRAEIAKAMTGPVADRPQADEPQGNFRLIIAGAEVPGGGIPSDGQDWVPLGPLLSATGWTRNRAEDEPDNGASGDTATALIRAATSTARVSLTQEGSQEMIELDDLVEEFNLLLRIDREGTRHVTGKPGGEAQTLGTEDFLRVTVARGQTLRDIARRHLGNADLWKSILSPEGAPYSEAAARQLPAGVQVLVPVAGPVAGNPAADVTDALDAGRFAEVAEAIAAITFRQNADAARTATPILLAACLAEGITDPSHLGYVLATAEHETNFGRQMIEVWGDPPSSLQRAYEGRFGNTERGDGKRYRGRGYVQLTFRDNYRRFGKATGLDLETHPELVEQPDNAARIIAVGMGRLGYTKGFPVLSTYGHGDDFDFFNARTIINGDRNTKTARYPVNYGTFIGRRALAYADAIRGRL